MKLLSFQPNSEKIECVDFLFERADKKQIVITLREKMDWPLIWGQSVEKVEKWILENYFELFYFFGFERMELNEEKFK